MAQRYRSSADDRSNQNPVFRAVTGYAKNVGKEARDVYRTWSAAQSMGMQVGPGTDARANELGGYVYKQLGQLGGSVIGRKYNKKGKRIN